MWRSPDPKREYDVVIIGGGGHGLGAAYFLAKEHGITNVAVVEKGWLGGGNTGRNTMTVRSNFLREDSVPFHEMSLDLYHQLSRDLNYNLMVSQRGMITFIQSSAANRIALQMANTMHIYGAEYRMLTLDEVKQRIPIFDPSPDMRLPVRGGVYQPRASMVRHDAVAWGYARAADSSGVDIIQNCEVTGIRQEGGSVWGVETNRGYIGAKKVAVVVAGHASVLAEMGGFRLPVESHPLQALVSEPLKPVLDTVVMSNAVHGYVSQSDKGELVIGAGIDAYTGYGQRGSFSIIEGNVAAIVELFPIFSRVRMLRQWGGIVDVCPDACPIISKTPVNGLYFNCGWGTGGFKATPGSGWVFAHTVANDEPHPLNAAFELDRFYSGALIDEHGAAGVAH